MSVRYFAPEEWYFSEDEVSGIVWGMRFDPSVEDSMSSYVQSEPPLLSIIWDEDFKKHGGTTPEFLISNIRNSLCWGVAIYIREKGSSNWIEACKSTSELEYQFDGSTYKYAVYDLVSDFNEDKIYNICAEKIEYGKFMSPVSNIVTYMKVDGALYGAYEFNDTLRTPSVQNISQKINYTMNINGEDIQYTNISISDDDGDVFMSGLNINGGGTTFFGSKWNDGVSKIITFTSKQNVSTEFYDWFIANTTKL
jgi:hypothetical protein